MKTSVLIAVLILCTTAGPAGEITIQQIRGDVQARQGVTEVWNRVAVGDVLRPDDSMKTGPGASAVILVSTATGDRKRILLPPEVIVDLSDVRELNREELMLKLAMERIRSSPKQEGKGNPTIPNAAVVHGSDRSTAPPLAENDVVTGLLVLNGARVLYDNGFYSTSALKALEVFRRYPSLRAIVENRLLVAEALRKAQLTGEALTEYGTILQDQTLTAGQRSLIESKMAELKQ